MTNSNAPLTNRRRGIDRRTVLRAAAWSAPVVAMAVATPLAAASTELPVLTFEVSPFVDADAPYGTRSVRISNSGPADFTGPLTFRMPGMNVAAPFLLAGAVHSRSADEDAWTVPSISVPAGETVALDLTWPGPFPLTPETQSLTVVTDPARGTITSTGSTEVTSPYQHLWAAVTPGGDGSPGGTTSIFIGNTTETPYDGQVSSRLPLWTLPVVAAVPLSVNGTRYPGVKTLENNQLLAAYPDIPVTVEARTGKQLFTLLWGPGGAGADGQQHRALIALGGLPFLGDVVIHSRYRVV
ncbi:MULTISPECIES: hypothetical protein [unclassified Microbacterium]|uniref:hypothetical protein n=1 Tax=unclassified Microbacterium TaxID=2609290 RepID=UPI0004935011|nr:MULTISPECIES: hypothetical protein [unclassified Microbacterium]